jgi:hypothetical protein
VTDKLEDEAEVDMLIVPANPSRLVRVIVEDCEEPTGISKAEGLAAILKPPLIRLVTVEPGPCRI